MRRGLLLATACLAAPAFAEMSSAQAQAEGDRLAALARDRMTKAQAMKPSAERNAELSATVKLIKDGLAAYLLAAEVSPEDAKAVEERMTDLRGMLFWCNKSFAVILRDSGTSKPPPAAPVPPPSAAPPPVHAAPPDAALPSRPPMLAEEEAQRIQTLLDEARKLSLRIEEAQDTWLRYTARVKAAPIRIDRLQKGFKPSSKPGITRQTLAAWDASREQILKEAHDYREKAFQKAQQIRAWRDRMAWCFARVEHFGPRAFPAMEAFAGRPNFPLNEDVIAYLNGQFSSAVFRMTPASPAPPPAPADAQAAERLLGQIAVAAGEREEHQAARAVQEARASWIDQDLKDLDAYWTWRDGQDFQPELKAAFVAKLEEGRKKAEKALKALEPKGEALEARAAALQASLDALPRALAPTVDAWRLKQGYLPAATGAALEAWMRGGGAP